MLIDFGNAQVPYRGDRRSSQPCIRATYHGNYDPELSSPSTSLPKKTGKSLCSNHIFSLEPINLLLREPRINTDLPRVTAQTPSKQPAVHT